MRQLADIAFLLHHYEFAAGTYRLAAQDYLAGNNVRWYAGAEVRKGGRGNVCDALGRRCGQESGCCCVDCVYGMGTPQPLSPPSQEMLGLCCILEPSDGNDPQKYFTRAYDSYTRLPGPLPRMLATRAMMASAAFQLSAGRHQAASHALMRAHFEVRGEREGGGRLG